MAAEIGVAASTAGAAAAFRARVTSSTLAAYSRRARTSTPGCFTRTFSDRTRLPFSRSSSSSEKIVGREVVGNLRRPLSRSLCPFTAMPSVPSADHRQRMGASQLRVGGQRQRGSRPFEATSPEVDRIERQLLRLPLR